MKRQDALSVGDIIKQAIERTGHADDFNRQQACYLWQDVVGPAINRYTTRRWVDHDTLHVCIASGVLKSELQYHTDRIVRLINEAVGAQAITAIIIH